jgi:hypothetical protein
LGWEGSTVKKRGKEKGKKKDGFDGGGGLDEMNR